MSWVLPILFLIAFEALADYLSKEWSLHRGAVRWLVAISAYVVANIFWLSALKHGSGLTRGAMIFAVGSAVVAVIIGLALYKEAVTKTQLAGVALGLVALILIFWGEA